MPNSFVITRATQVQTDFSNAVLRHAATILQRDIQNVTTNYGIANRIVLTLNTRLDLAGDTFIIQADTDQMKVCASTELGVMYGALTLSREKLGISDFWFWLDKLPQAQPRIEVTHVDQLKLPQYQVRYRGWFVNDEVLLAHWDYRDSQVTLWELIFETLLRCGGNLIIPGTDKTSHSKRRLASEMGLMIAQHHAEPLGADMFARVYPDLEASYLKHPDLFKQIWQSSIDQQRGERVIWNLGFRGQGDRPFWLDEDREYTDSDKAAVINRVIETQYQLVKKANPDAICSMNIYGELVHLYGEGLIKLPADTIQIWADNGYGKMTSRRQGNVDLRLPVFKFADRSIPQGIYYHVAFHDLQASNFLTMLSVDPGYISQELAKVHAMGMDQLVLCNTGNIKPHILLIREVAKSWVRGYVARSTTEILDDYVHENYSESITTIVRMYQRYFELAPHYGSAEDQCVGDEFYAYTMRRLIRTWLTHTEEVGIPDFEWLTGQATFDQQLSRLSQIVRSGKQPWTDYIRALQQLLPQLTTDDAQRLYNDLYLSSVLHVNLLRALVDVLDAYRLMQNKEAVQAFLSIDTAVNLVQHILRVERENPQPKWQTFYRNDCYTNIRLLMSELQTLRSYLRIAGDGPDEDQWERKYWLMPADARVMLLSNTHCAYSDEELAQRLRVRLNQ